MDSLKSIVTLTVNTNLIMVKYLMVPHLLKMLKLRLMSSMLCRGMHRVMGLFFRSPLRRRVMEGGQRMLGTAGRRYAGYVGTRL